MKNFNFQIAIENSAQKFKALAKKDVLLFHHNDADGLSSGAILKKAFERHNLRVRNYCLEKPYPKVLEYILSDSELSPETIIVFTDFASGMLPTIVKIAKPNQQIFVLDHHQVEEAKSDRLNLINPLLHEISGSTECTASSVCYLFAKALASYNVDLAETALVGIIGDGQIGTQGELSGPNLLVLEDAIKNGAKNVEGQLYTKDHQSINKIASAVDALGGFAYLRGGPDIALKGLQEGFSEGYYLQAATYEKEFEDYYAKFLKTINLQETEHLQYFILDEKSKKFGVKTVGLLASRYAKEPCCQPEKYIMGFQEIPQLVPGLGPIEISEYKISMRLPPKLAARVKSGSRPSLTEILPLAARKIGGFVDACHPHAAAVTVAIGKENELVLEVESQVLNFKNGN